MYVTNAQTNYLQEHKTILKPNTIFLYIYITSFASSSSASLSSSKTSCTLSLSLVYRSPLKLFSIPR